MNRLFLSNSFLRRKFILALLISSISGCLWLILSHRDESTSCAQTLTGCPGLSSNHKGWPKNSTVYYNVDNLSEPVKSQAVSAFDKWTSANLLNCSGVSFKNKNSVTPPAAVKITFSIGAANEGPAEIRLSVNVDGTTQSAVIVIDANN